jgi:hypothetical protein
MYHYVPRRYIWGLSVVTIMPRRNRSLPAARICSDLAFVTAKSSFTVTSVTQPSLTGAGGWTIVSSVIFLPLYISDFTGLPEFPKYIVFWYTDILTIKYGDTFYLVMDHNAHCRYPPSGEV